MATTSSVNSTNTLLTSLLLLSRLNSNKEVSNDLTDSIFSDSSSVNIELNGLDVIKSSESDSGSKSILAKLLNFVVLLIAKLTGSDLTDSEDSSEPQTITLKISKPSTHKTTSRHTPLSRTRSTSNTSSSSNTNSSANTGASSTSTDSNNSTASSTSSTSDTNATSGTNSASGTTTTNTNSTSGTTAASDTSSTSSTTATTATTTTTEPASTTKPKTTADIEADYLRANPDVATAVAKGQVKSGLQHYILAGQKEGRSYDLTDLGYNEADYLRANPDVALAVAKGSMANGLTHYMTFGINEGRKLK